MRRARCVGLTGLTWRKLISSRIGSLAILIRYPSSASIQLKANAETNANVTGGTHGMSADRSERIKIEYGICIRARRS